MKVNEINKNRYILETLIDRALLDSIIWVTNRCHPQEPDYVAALSTKFLKDFFHILSAVFPNYDFSVTGVYCHQKPIVDINQDKMPELGDILFVYVDRNQNDNVKLNSLLLQAKISNSSRLKVHSEERHQLELYKNWPKFTYHRAGHLNGQTRNILPKSINDGAQYLLIDDNPITNGLFDKNGFPMGCAVPDDTLYINDSFSVELIDFLKFKSGRTFERYPYSTEDDWTKMIWDLLGIAKSKYSKRKNSGFESFPRSFEYIHECTKSAREFTLFNEIEMNDNFDALFEKSDRGVSVVLIESRPRNEDIE